MKKNTFEVFFLSLSRKTWIVQVQRLTIRLELIKRPFATVCGVPHPIDLSTAIPHPLWRRNKHPNRVFWRGSYHVRVVQQENDRQHRFSLRGSHQLVSELRLFLVGLPFILSLLFRVNLESKIKISSCVLVCSCWFLNFLLVCSWTVLNFVVNFSFCVSFLS